MNFWTQLVFVAVLLAHAPVFAQEETAIGTVIAITGTAEFRVDGGEPVAKAGDVVPASFEVWEKVKPHQPVYARDKFKTLRKSRLKILFSDKSLIALGPNSEVKVESYLHKPEDKLRQGAINVVSGLSMYIVNKSQTNEKSSFKIVTPTGNISARGTHGYTSSSPFRTLVANQAGKVVAANNFGFQDVGSMMKTVIPKDQAPEAAQALTPQELSMIRNVVLARMGPSSAGGENPMISAPEEKQKKKKKKSESGDGDSKSGTKGTALFGESTLRGGDTNALGLGGGELSGGEGIFASSDEGLVGEFFDLFVQDIGFEPSEYGLPEDFAGGFDLFGVTDLEACSK